MLNPSKPPSLRAKSARIAARTSSTGYAVTVRQLVESSERRAALENDPHSLTGSLDKNADSPNSSSSMTEHTMHQTVEDELHREIRDARRHINKEISVMFPELCEFLPKSRWPTKRQKSPMTHRYPKPTISPKKTQRLIQSRKAGTTSFSTGVLLDDPEHFRSLDHWAQHSLDQIETSSTETSTRPAAAEALRLVVEQILTKSSLLPETSARLLSALWSFISDDEGFPWRTLSDEHHQAAATTRAILDRRNMLINRIDVQEQRRAVKINAANSALAFRIWRLITHTKHTTRSALLRSFTTAKRTAKLSAAFLSWRRFTASAKRRFAESMLRGASSEAEQAKHNLLVSVSQTRDEALRRIMQLQKCLEEEKALRNTQFTTFTTELRALSEELTQTQKKCTGMMYERDLWRHCWTAMRNTTSLSDPTPISSAIFSCAENIRDTVSEICDRHRLIASPQSMGCHHRSVSEGQESSPSSHFAKLQSTVHDLLLQWVNSLAAGDDTSDVAVLEGTDLGHERVLRYIVDRTLSLYGMSRTGKEDLFDSYVELCRNCSAFPLVQPLLAFCPYADSHMTREKFRSPEFSSWFYWLTATAFLMFCAVGPTQQLRKTSHFDFVGMPLSLSSLLRRPFAEPVKASSLTPHTTKQNAKLKKPKPHRGANPKSATLDRAIGKNPSDVKLGIRDTTTDSIVAELATYGDSDAALQLDEFDRLTSLQGSWNGIASLVAFAIVELNCLEFDPERDSFRFPIPVFTERVNERPPANDAPTSVNTAFNNTLLQSILDTFHDTV